MSVDYRHPLRLGLLLTPGDDGPQAAVERARLGEELGYDLVSFRPGASELDPWTLLSWTAARTTRVHLAAHPGGPGINPALVARAAASLDLLADGRAELILSAEPGLDEAIDIVRGIWTAHLRSPLSFAGEHHRLAGAERGPAPAHNLPILLTGAPDPALLRLAGTKADGWLRPPADGGSATDGWAGVEGWAGAEGRAGANAAIDQAAVAAGRDPREIHRLTHFTGRFTTAADGAESSLTGPPEGWISALLPLILDQGVSTLILTTDDPATIRRFATDVAPALRAARGEIARSEQVPSLYVRRHRRDGIAYDAVPESLAGSAIEPGDAGFGRVRSTYLRGGSPGLVLRPGTPGEVAEAVRFARTQPVKLSVRSGGHGISGRSTNNGGIVIDLSRLHAIEILDKATRRVRVEPGARWRDVAAALSPHGWALSSGDYGGVGVGGLATSGGIGWLVREHGLTVDHLRAVDLVLADGTRVRADEEENAELFWGVRGAGANFGIVTSFEFEADEVGEVGFGQFVMDASDTAGFLERWGAVMEAAPRDLTSFLIIGRPRLGQPTVVQVMAVVDSRDAETIVARLQPLASVAPVLDYSIQVLPYEAIMNAPQAPHDGQGEPVTRSALAGHLTPELAGDVGRLIAGGLSYFFSIRSVGGAVADVPSDATAYAGRSANFQLVAFGANRRALDSAWDAMLPHFSGLYLNFETDLRPERLHDAYPEAHLRRLRALKRRYDPDNVFRDNFNITPEPDQARSQSSR
ncbi:LLM class flavin-dependent oxidoreductase [Nonomuraea fuscirosea]|uniref:LLM class flavin-dependent oxidoreductase n=1 Tax=Nonomuraea fuscirosea TaxID=1291556 RepID=UPI0037A23218